ncbi:MAG: DUF4395 family protein [Reichenbachiella sp.]
MKKKKLLTEKRTAFLRAQGYTNQSREELSELAFGNRLAYQLCFCLLVVGISTAHIPTLLVMLTIAFGGVILPNHPFDLIYNQLISGLLGKPKLPARSAQLKFACTIATLWIAGVIYLFQTGNALEAYLLGSSLLIAVSSVAFFDYCVPSFFYNIIFKVNRIA